MLGAIDTYKAALTIIPDRADALSNLGAAYVRLGQYDDAIAQYEAALKADPTNNTIRLNLALAYYKSARPNQAIPQLKRIVASAPRGEERVSGARRLLPADGPGSGAHLAAEAARADVRRRPRLCVSARHGAAAHGTISPKVRSTSTGYSAPANPPKRTCCSGWRISAARTIREAKTELERAVKLNPQAADGALAVRPVAAGARRAGRGRARVSRGARLQRQRLRGQPAAREHAQVRAEVRRGLDLSRARDDDPPERSHRAQAAGQPAASDRQRR